MARSAGVVSEGGDSEATGGNQEVKLNWKWYYIQILRQGAIPFEITTKADPFYSEANIKRLRKAIADANAGKLIEHELVEVEDD